MIFALTCYIFHQYLKIKTELYLLVFEREFEHSEIAMHRLHVGSFSTAYMNKSKQMSVVKIKHEKQVKTK